MLYFKIFQSNDLFFVFLKTQFVFYNYYYNRNSIEKKDKSDEIHMTQQGK